MALNNSGPISLAGATTGQSIALELGLSATGQISLNQSNVRTLAAVPSGAITMPTDFWGKANAFNGTITTNQLNLNLRTWALANGWNGNTIAYITVAPNVYIYSNSTATPALTIDGSWPNGVILINQGFVMGQGGNSANGPGLAGGPAISLGISCTIDNTNVSAYIGGGGGGGGSVGLNSTGGGGAGGGNAVNGGAGGGLGASGSPGVANAYSGGGGGRIFPGVGGAGGNFGSGGGAGGGGGQLTTNPSGTHGVTIANVCQYSNPGVRYSGGGGGGWGAIGGYGMTNSTVGGTGGSANNPGGSGNGSIVNSGGAGGRAVQLNGYSVTWVSGDTTRVYGAIA